MVPMRWQFMARREARRVAGDLRTAYKWCAIKRLERFMKLSTRNHLAGTVQQVRKGEAMATVKVELRGGDVITAAITADAVDDLGLEPGSSVTVLVKSTEVMLATE